MYLRLTAVCAAALALGVSACGGYTAPTAPTFTSSSPSMPSDATTINIVGVDGAMSFSPNPATLVNGQMVVWHNVDTITHRVVLDDGRIDTGNIPPRSFSAPSRFLAPARYHCSIHPVMVGRIDETGSNAGDDAVGKDGSGGGAY